MVLCTRVIAHWFEIGLVIVVVGVDYRARQIRTDADAAGRSKVSP